jgi:hypothetical protein
MNDAVIPFDFSSSGHDAQLQMPPTGFPSFQAMVPTNSAYQPTAPALAQANPVFNTCYFSSTGTGFEVNTNVLHCIHETRIRCTANGCTKTFRRPGDYRRHMRKHRAPTFM